MEASETEKYNYFLTECFHTMDASLHVSDRLYNIISLEDGAKIYPVLRKHVQHYKPYQSKFFGSNIDRINAAHTAIQKTEPKLNVGNCPFCGFNDNEVKRADRKRFYIYCYCCESRGPIGYGPERAIKLWNRKI